MVIFKWSHSLETGIPLVDKQHQEIIETANRFFIRCKCSKDKAAVGECLRFLQQYILYHFQAEEAFQRSCNYPDCANHNAKHKSLATQVTFFAVKLSATNYAERTIDDFYTFLSGWITSHVFEEDLDFAQYCKDHVPAEVCLTQESSLTP